MRFIVVFIGGMVGAMCRYGVSELLNIGDGFPIGTFLINVVGCFFLAWFLTYARNWNEEFILLIGTGFTGAFTTFSSFSLETVKVLQSGVFLKGMIYPICSIAVGLSMSYAGYIVAKKMKGAKGFD